MKTAFLTSFNSDLIKVEFEKFGKQKDINIECWWNAYGRHEESVYNTASQLYQFDPEVIIIHFEVESLLGELAFDLLSSISDIREKQLEDTKAKVYSLISTLCKNFPNSKIIVQNFVSHTPIYLGLLDSNIKYGLSELVLELNLFISSLKNIFQDKLFVQDFNALITEIGICQSYDSRLYHLTKYPFAKSFSKELFQHYSKIISMFLIPRKKCIVLDLDNTLWGGIIGQDGIENIELGSSGLGESFVEFQRALLNFYRRGIILTVCSKNNYDDAVEVIEKHPNMILRKKHFSSLQINWLNKADNIRNIADQLILSTDSFVFLDNDPAECELVRQQLPEVTVVHLTSDPGNYIKQLLSINALETISLTEEDISRNQIYQENSQRIELHKKSYSLEDYFRSLEMKAYVSINEKSYITRVSQLTQKTNQFNLTAKKYTTEEICSLIRNVGNRVYALRLIDKFGDNGIVLIAIVECNLIEWTIDSFIMSCRIMGRQAETALLNVIIHDAEMENITVLQGEYLPTLKNIPATDFYLRHNFERVSESTWKLNLPATHQKHCIEIIREN